MNFPSKKPDPPLLSADVCLALIYPTHFTLVLLYVRNYDTFPDIGLQTVFLILLLLVKP